MPLADGSALAGTIGVLLFVGSYFSLQAGYVRGSGATYALMNLGASFFVLVSLTAEFNLYSAIVQVSWMLISIFGLARLFLQRRAVRFTPEEMDFVTAKLARMPRINARRVLTAGHWLDVAEPTVLIEEGVPSEALFYLADGSARVESEGKLLAWIRSGSLLGEITVLSDEPATARVVAEPGARLFRLGRDALHRLVSKDAELREQVTVALTRDTHGKMIAVNQALRTDGGRAAREPSDQPVPGTE